MPYGSLGIVPSQTRLVGGAYTINTQMRGRYVIRIIGISTYHGNASTHRIDNCTCRWAYFESNEWYFRGMGGNENANRWYINSGVDQVDLKSPMVGQMEFSGSPITFRFQSVYGNATLPTHLIWYYEAIDVNTMPLPFPMKLPTLCRFTILNGALYNTINRDITIPVPQLSGRYRARVVFINGTDSNAFTAYTNAQVIQFFSTQLNDFGCVNHNESNGGLLWASRTNQCTTILNSPFPEFITNTISGSITFRMNSPSTVANMRQLYLEMWIEFYSLDDELEPLGTNAF